jgi:hypothetical protein
MGVVTGEYFENIVCFPLRFLQMLMSDVDFCILYDLFQCFNVKYFEIWEH